MALGYRDTTYMGEISQGDTAELTAYLRINEQPVAQNQVTSVSFTVQLPDNTSQTLPGTVQADGSGYLRWTNTNLVGEYKSRAKFTLTSGEIRSVMQTFVVIDPFNPPTPSETDLLVDQVQLRLEDCFDSIEGGPWLKDVSLAHFDYSKIADFIPEALLDINVQMPPTNLTIDDFTMPTTVPGQTSTLNPNMPLLVQGVLVLVIRHLMRSYTEQPVPQGAQVVWQDRTRYQELWNRILQVEQANYIERVRLWKRTAYHFGQSALLTLSKAGRLYPYGSQRSRGVYRGYW